MYFIVYENYEKKVNLSMFCTMQSTYVMHHTTGTYVTMCKCERDANPNKFHLRFVPNALMTFVARYHEQYVSLTLNHISQKAVQSIWKMMNGLSTLMLMILERVFNWMLIAWHWMAPEHLQLQYWFRSTHVSHHQYKMIESGFMGHGISRKGVEYHVY